MKARVHGEVAEPAAEVALESAASLGEEEMAALAVLVVVAAGAYDHAGHTDSWSVEVPAGSALRLGEYRPSCCLETTARVRGLVAAGSGSERPIVDLAERQVHRAGTPVDARLAAVAHRLGLADHW